MSSDSHNHCLNIVTGVDSTHTQVAQTALRLCGRADVAPQYREDKRAVRSAAGTRLGFSREKAAREIGWEPQVSLEQGMQRLLAWQQAQS